MVFAAALRAARVASGRTQSDVAKATGIARLNISAYEAGRREPRISTAERLLAAVGASILVERDVG